MEREVRRKEGAEGVHVNFKVPDGPDLVSFFLGDILACQVLAHVTWRFHGNHALLVSEDSKNLHAETYSSLEKFPEL